MSSPPIRRAEGFTLLEVLVALAILSLTVVVAMQGFAQGLRLLKLSGDHQRAILLADQKVREVIVPKAGHDAGTDGLFAWERTVKAVPAPELETPARPARWHVYEVSVQVAWGEQRRAVAVTTLRTVSETPEQGRLPR
jgi:prepilin-type N-terminal cleavage/methylation domain-containing protein